MGHHFPFQFIEQNDFYLKNSKINVLVGLQLYIFITIVPWDLDFHSFIEQFILAV